MFVKSRNRNRCLSRPCQAGRGVSLPAADLLEARTLLSVVPVVPTYPIITYNSTGVTTYDSDTGAIDITATPLRFRVDSSSSPLVISGDRSLEIQAILDSAGNLLDGVAGDDLVITGDIDVDGDGTIDFSGTLLTGEVTYFGYQESGATDKYEFVFTLTGGALLSYFIGNDIGVTVTSENSTFNNSFEADFTGGAKGNVGAVPTQTSPTPEIAVEKSGPDYAYVGESLTYTYTVTNPSEVSLSDVTVVDDQAGVATYVSGDTDGDSLLDSDETWVFSATYTPESTFPDALTNTATASGTFGGTTVTATDDYTLESVVLSKELFLYWDAENADNSVAYEAQDDAVFTVDVYKDGELIDTIQLGSGDSVGLWLGDGSYTFQETDLPDGYVAVADQVTYQTGQSEDPSLTLVNVITFDLAVEKTGPETASAGSTITYTYTVTNAGPAKVAPVLSDDLAGTPTYVSGDADGDGLISSDEVWVYKISYVVPATTTTSSGGCSTLCCCPTPSETTVTNIVTVDNASNPHSTTAVGGDTNAGNNTDSWTVTVTTSSGGGDHDDHDHHNGGGCGDHNDHHNGGGCGNNQQNHNSGGGCGNNQQSHNNSGCGSSAGGNNQSHNSGCSGGYSYTSSYSGGCGSSYTSSSRFGQSSGCGSSSNMWASLTGSRC